MQEKWIPITDRKPNSMEFVENYDSDHYGAAFLTTVSGKKSPVVLFYSQTGHWYDENQIDYEVVAWMKLPEIYREMARMRAPKNTISIETYLARKGIIKEV